MMNEVATILSRYGVVRTLCEYGPNTYRLGGESHYGRYGYKEDGSGLLFADMEGGPFVQLGDAISFFGAKNDERRISKIALDETSGEKVVLLLLTVE